MTVVATLLSGVLPGTSSALAAAEMYTDPPELAPLAEEEPLIAKSVAKRRNEFVTVRYCARQALGELGVPPVPILKGDKGEPCWPDGVVGSLTHCEGYRGAAVGRRAEVRSVGIDAEPHDVLPKGVLDAISLPAERAGLHAIAVRIALGPNPVLRQGGNVQGVVSADPSLARVRGCAHHVRRRRHRHRGRVRVADSDRPDRIVGAAAGDTVGPLVGARRSGADGDRPVTDAGLVVVDKPAGITSHDVVGRCRRIFGTRKVGHAGTLDPMATGVLVVGIERATKILGLLTATDKSYAATIRLGQTTSTEDAEGEVLQTVSADGVTDAQIEEAVAALRGEIAQIPSAVSAIKVGGKRAYQLAREGQTVELAPRSVRIDRFDVLAVRRA